MMLQKTKEEIFQYCQRRLREERKKKMNDVGEQIFVHGLFVLTCLGAGFAAYWIVKISWMFIKLLIWFVTAGKISL